MARQIYTDKQRALWVLECQMAENIAAVARRPGSPPESTLRSWVNRFYGKGQPQGTAIPPDVYAEKKRDIVEELGELQHQTAGVLREKLPEATAKEAAVILAILIDKRQLLTGQPTEITKDVSDHRSRVLDGLAAQHGRLVANEAPRVHHGPN